MPFLVDIGEKWTIYVIDHMDLDQFVILRRYGHFLLDCRNSNCQLREAGVSAFDAGPLSTRDKLVKNQKSH